MKLTFSKIHRESIFNADFDNLQADNGTIEFKRKGGSGGIAVVYAPNGTGKSSFTEVLKSEASSEQLDFKATDENGRELVPADKAFQIVSDQISRHVIEGDESQYLVGVDIRREYELIKKISEGFDSAFKTSLPTKFKSQYRVSKISDYILSRIEEVDARGYTFIKSIVNTRSRGKDIDRNLFIAYIKKQVGSIEPLELDEGKTQFVVRDCAGEKVIPQLLGIEPNAIIVSEEAPLIERHSDAIIILNKYRHLHSCVVCDNDSFDGEALLGRKTEQKRLIYERLDQKTKTLLDKVAMDRSLIQNDPFNIKQIVLGFISGNGAEEFEALQLELETYVKNLGVCMIRDLVACFDGTNMIADFDELSQLRAVQPTFDSDDLIYIQDVMLWSSFFVTL